MGKEKRGMDGRGGNGDEEDEKGKREGWRLAGNDAKKEE